MYQEFNEIYLKYKKFLPQKLAFKMAYKSIQGRKQHVYNSGNGRSKNARKAVKLYRVGSKKENARIFENDYLGLDYFLYDANDSEIMRLEQ